MSSHKGSVVAQGNGAPASNRETDTLELAELGPLLEEKGTRVIANPTKAEEEQACPVPQEEEEEVRVLTLPLQAHHAMEKMEEFVYKEKVVFGMFFLGAVLCLSFSWLFHTVYCHSEKVSRTFSKLDYSGIALLIMGSFVPWLYYSFYCSPQPRLIYLSIVCVLGISAIIVAQWDRFATPKHRQTRAGVFLGLGLSGVVPTMHFTIAEGFVKATTVGQMGWFFLMAVMYITGAGLYAARIPERFFPGKFDIWFQSHQIFHVLVVAAAFVHFYGVSNLQEFRYGLEGGCTDDSLL
ncbi:adiponectin receptor protein 1 isoform X2 [Equus asinus]|uniref:adiponectin receptor protein 1 isoform X2 n=1 Tax=Equus asinus TaxID=9793 RepID=UPI0038F6FD12